MLANQLNEISRISIWDFHREKIALLTEKTLIIVTYNFIKSRIENYNRIELSNLKKVIHGNLKYPKKSMMGSVYYQIEIKN